MSTHPDLTPPRLLPNPFSSARSEHQALAPYLLPVSQPATILHWGCVVKRALLLVPLLLAMSAVAHASPCLSGVLNTYEAPGFSCGIDALTFSSFGYSAVGTGGALLVLPSSVSVTPCSGCTTPGEFGFQFLAPWSVSSGQTQETLISFAVSCACALVDAASSISGFGFSGSGSALVTETLSNGTVLFLMASSGGVKPFDSATFAGVTTINVVEDIKLNGSGALGGIGSAGISALSSTFSTGATPEPSSLLLLGSGIIALGGYRRRRSVLDHSLSVAPGFAPLCGDSPRFLRESPASLKSRTP